MTKLPEVVWRPLLGADGEPIKCKTNDELIVEFEEAAIAYREYQCGETGKRYDDAKQALLDAMYE